MASVDDLRALIQQRTGLEVPMPSPQFDLAVTERMRRLGLDRTEAYLALIRDLPENVDEWTQIIHASTNRLTQFFRDHEQLEITCTLLEQMATLNAGTPLQVWCAGCATGEEAYSLAMLTHARGLASVVYGSDINELALAVARRGNYATWSLRNVPPDMREQYFHTTSEGTHEVKGMLKDRTLFCRHNLIKDPALMPQLCGGWDLIVCRNVIIYYSESAASALLQRLAASLKDSGVLVLGASESAAGRDVTLRPQMAFGRVVYTSVSSRRQVPALTSIVSRLPPPMPSSLPSAQAKPAAVSSSPEPSSPQPEAPAFTSYSQIRDHVVAAMSSGAIDEARAILSDVLSKNTQDVLANLALGHIFLITHEFKRALEAYETVVNIEPTLPEAHYFLGLTERKQRSFRHALFAFRKAVFLEPTFWCASYQLGAVALRLGKRVLQFQEWQRTLDLLKTGGGTLPLVSHPVFFDSLLVTASEATEICESALRQLREAKIVSLP